MLTLCCAAAALAAEPAVCGKTAPMRLAAPAFSTPRLVAKSVVAMLISLIASALPEKARGTYVFPRPGAALKIFRFQCCWEEHKFAIGAAFSASPQAGAGGRHAC